MNPNTLQAVKIFLLMFLMFISITSQTAFSQTTLKSSLHNYTASQQFDGAESSKVPFFFTSACHTVLIMFGSEMKVGVTSQPCQVSLSVTKVPFSVISVPPSFLLLMILPIKSKYIKITQSKNNYMRTTCSNVLVMI